MNIPRKTIWMCWFQGENDIDMPQLNMECISRWRQFNPDYRIHVLDNQSIQDFVPEFFTINRDSPKRSLAAQSDLLRVLLLSKFGGVWVDTSVYPMLPLNSFYYKLVNDTGFFAYRFFPRKLSPRGGYAETASWFMCFDYSGHPLSVKLKNAFIKRYKFDKDWQYLTLHDTLCNLYDSDSEINCIINNMIQINADIPHSALHYGWNQRSESFLYKRPPGNDKSRT